MQRSHAEFPCRDPGAPQGVARVDLLAFLGVFTLLGLMALVVGALVLEAR